MNRVILIFAFIGVITVNGVFAQIERFDNLLPMVFVEGNNEIDDFYIGKFEVTQDAWVAVMGKNPSKFKNGDKYPVEWINWYDIEQFINRLNELTGRSYRLPTAEEWLYAARGGNKSEGYRYSGSNDVNEVAWYKESRRNAGQRRITSRAGTKQPNELGIFDMSGNVSEFVQLQYYGSMGRRVLAGGSFLLPEQFSRIDEPQWTQLARIARNRWFGFRVAYTTPDAQPISENIPVIEHVQPVVANTNVQTVVERTEINITKGEIPIYKGNAFINASTSNFGITTGGGATSFNLSANGGYFVANRFALVGGLGYNLVSSDFISFNSLSIKAGVRYYLVSANNGGLFINSLIDVTKPNDLKAEFGLNIGAGYSFFLNNRMSFEPTVNFVMPFTEGSVNIFVIGGGFSIFF